MIKDLLKIIPAPEKKRFIIFFILVLVVAGLEVLGLGAIIPFMTILIDPSAIDKIPVLASFLAFLVLLTGQSINLIATELFITLFFITLIVRMIHLNYQTKIPYQLGAFFSVKIYSNVMNMPYIWHIHSRSSEIIDVISNKTGAIVGTIIMGLILISSLIIAISISIALAFIDLNLLLIFIGSLFFIYSLIAFFTKNKLVTDGENIALRSTENIKILQEGIGSIRDVILDSSQKDHVKKFKISVFQLRNAQAQTVLRAQFPRLFIETGTIILLAIVIYILTLSRDGLEKWLPIIAVFVVGLQRLIPNLQQIYMSWASIKSNEASFLEAFGFLSLKKDSSLSGSMVNFSNIESIELFNVDFKYTNENFSLRKINFKINKGERVGIVGPSGAGKSTFIDILMGLLSPDGGSYMVDGLSVNRDSMRILQKHISHVPQNVFLLDDSIKANIALGVAEPNIDNNKILVALKKAKLYDFVTSLPFGLDTIIGERGIQISGGQRQRLGIARALYRDAQLIILDEATSALDEPTETDVMESIYALSKEVMLVMVAHRKQTLKCCTRIIEILDGEIANEWSYAEYEKMN